MRKREFFTNAVAALVLCFSANCADEDKDKGKDGTSNTTNDMSLIDSFKEADASKTTCEQVLIQECYVGSSFVDCPGAYQPKAFCSEAAGGNCVWVSNGCPVAPYTIPFEENCLCSSEACPFDGSMESFVLKFGSSIWDRNSYMDISLTFDPNLETSEQTLLTCTGLSETCSTTPNPCCEEYPGEPPEPISLNIYKRMEGTFIAEIYAARVMAGYYIMIEADAVADQPRARICRIAYSDNLSCTTPSGYPICADSGSLTLDSQPSPDNIQPISGMFEAHFPDGTQISGSF